MEKLCVPESIPENFHQQLGKLTINGFRVIGLAAKELDRKSDFKLSVTCNGVFELGKKIGVDSKPTFYREGTKEHGIAIN